MTRSRLLTALLACALVLVTSGCATRFRSEAHRDTTYDFSRISTYAFAPEREEQAASKNGQLVAKAIAAELQERGYKEAPKAEADVLISYEIGVHAAARLSGGNSFAHQQGGITVRVSDRATGHTIWYGWSEKTLTSEDTAEVAIPEAVDALFHARITDATL